MGHVARVGSALVCSLVISLALVGKAKALPNFDSAAAVAIQGDGKIVAAGIDDLLDSSSGRFALTRYNSDGTLDQTFGTGGKVHFVSGLLAGDFDSANAAALQSDGKIIIAGYIAGHPESDFALVRLKADGSLDSTFGSGGIVATNFAFPGSSSAAEGVVIQSDQKIVAVGYSNSNSSKLFEFVVARFNPDGSFDTTFGAPNGWMFAGNHNFDSASAVVVQTDGKLVVGGGANSGQATNPLSYTVGLIRLNGDGSLDSNFGSGGYVIGPSSNNSLILDQAHALSLQSDGKIVVGADNAIIRYFSNGLPDSGFGNLGTVTIPSSVYAVSLQGDGKILAAGILSGDFWLKRFNAGGTSDQSFGSQGAVTTDFSGYASADAAHAMALQTDGEIVLAGISDASGSTDFALARYLTNGSLDTGFGKSGKVLTNFGTPPNFDIAVRVSAPPQLTPGEYATYGVTATNNGPDPVTSVAVTINVSSPVLPGPPGGFTNFGTLQPNQSASYFVQGNVACGAAPNIPATVAAALVNPPGDTNPANDSASATAITTGPSDVEIGFSGPNTAKSGDRITYIFNVRNKGPSLATRVAFNESIPQGLSPGFINPSQGGCLSPGSCLLGDLPAGSSATVTATFQVTAPAKTTLSGAGAVSSCTVNTESGNDSVPTTTTVTP